MVYKYHDVWNSNVSFANTFRQGCTMNKKKYYFIEVCDFDIGDLIANTTQFAHSRHCYLLSYILIAS